MRHARPRMTIFGVVAAALLSSAPTPLFAASPSAAPPQCGSVKQPCEILSAAGGRYYAKPPPDWDGKRPLGALLFFHGYQSSGAAFIENQSVLNAAHRGGYMLVAADGINGSWSHTGAPTQNRNEVTYVRDLLDDLARRFPIRQDELWVSGFSQGGSMVWETACYLGQRFKAFVPIAGAFWQPLPTTCPGGPVNILHIHGTADRTVPMLGRPIGPYRQGEVMKAWAVMKAVDQCSPLPQSTGNSGRYQCETWTDCRSKRLLEICLHDNGHEIPAGWDDLAYAFLAKIKK